MSIYYLEIKILKKRAFNSKVQDSDLAHFFGGRSESEKHSEIKLLLVESYLTIQTATTSAGLL